MFTKFASFWIKNKKLTTVIILIILFSGIFSWFMIPKQYNPKIEAPAFNITVPAPGYSSKEVSELIVKPLENKIGEIDGVDDIFGYSQNDFGSVMVSFKVGENKENSTIKIYNKIFSNLDLKSYGVQNPIIKNIDPEELPVYSIALYSSSTGVSSMQLRKTALDIIDGLKSVKNVRGFFLVGGEKETITVSVDLQKAESKNIAITSIVDKIKKNNIGLPGGKIRTKSTVGTVEFDGNFDSLNDIKSLVVGSNDGKYIKLEEIANITFSVPEKTQSTWIWSKDFENTEENTIFIGVGKKDGTNAVYVVQDIKERLLEIQKKLPGSYKIKEIQNLGKKAEDATNMLIVNLFQSIVIVLIILTIVLGFKNAINVAISIPLTLSIVFLYSLVVGDNINRITLFALILVLGMLVDDATVVVENINRKLNDIKKKTDKDNDLLQQKKVQLKAIFDAIKEVELGVILSTVTRLLAFGAMFFVTGMMGEYMGPIPKYSIVAMITSTIVALSINPFLTYVFFDKSKKSPKKTNFIKKFGKKHQIPTFFNFLEKVNLFLKTQRDILGKKFENLGISFKRNYFNFMNYFFDESKPKRIKYFKIGFRIFLFLILFIPPALQIFKMRMLPKSNQNQIFLRIDMPEDSSYKNTKKVSEKVVSFLKKNKLIKSISVQNGIAPIPDFSNIFRNSMGRIGEKFISMRINLVDVSQRDISSEQFVIKNRKKIKQFLNKLSPNSQLRILEEPPGPPTQATFMLKVNGESFNNYGNVESFASWIYEKLQPMFQQQKVVDFDNSISTYKTKYIIKLDHQRASDLGLDAELVAMTIRTVFDGIPMTVFHNTNNKEGVNIHISAKNIDKNTKKIFEKITIPNSKGGFVNLSEISKIIPTENEHTVYSDNKKQSVYIFGEMGDNSVIYPSIMTLRLLLTNDFWEGKYDILERDLYKIVVEDKLTKEKYTIGLGGERELTIDTFRDLGLAMIIAFLAIYFVMVGQFKGFAIGGSIMLSFLFGFFGVFPLFTILFLLNNEYFSATSMIGVIALSGIVVGNAILLLEYVIILVKQQNYSIKDAVIQAGWTRMKPIVVTSLTTIFGATTILGDPVWSGLALSLIGGLIASAIMTPIILPLFLFGNLKENKDIFN